MTGREQGFVGRELGDPGLKPTVRVGEAALREVAAFLLDYQGFAKVRAGSWSCTVPLVPHSIGRIHAEQVHAGKELYVLHALP